MSSAGSGKMRQLANMSELEQRLLPLRKMGFTRYQLKVYASLISLGLTTAYQISYVTKVPYTKAYTVLNDLRKMGLIVEDKRRPRRYKARPPANALTALRDGFVEGLDGSLGVAIRELRPVFALNERREDHGVWNIAGRNNVLDKMKDLLRECDRKALIAFPDIGNIGHESLVPILKGLKKKQVRVRIIASPKEMKYAQCYEGLADIKFIDGVESRYVVVDDGVLLIGPGRSELGPDSWSAVWATCKNCVKRSEEHFENAWKHNKRTSQLVVGSPKRWNV
jgi:sugar-specific transcriptional regulator TrmB